MPDIYDKTGWIEQGDGHNGRRTFAQTYKDGDGKPQTAWLHTAKPEEPKSIMTKKMGPREWSLVKRALLAFLGLVAYAIIEVTFFQS